MIPILAKTQLRPSWRFVLSFGIHGAVFFQSASGTSEEYLSILYLYHSVF
ncbi:hypothetical protein LEP1GSC055_3069 [Leptospira borgpetersenii str. Brem 307]|nr:hypothetical protein LEP1GSC055_3069 [Leptospira borgpetersenii str. Brem 307]